MNIYLNEKEIIEKLFNKIIEDIEAIIKSNGRTEIKGGFSQKEIEYLLKNKLIEKEYRSQCDICGEMGNSISYKEMELFDYYETLKSEKNKSMETLMKLDSIEQILDFKCGCRSCGLEIILNKDIEPRKYFKKEVYKISLKAKHLALSEFTKNVKIKEAI